VNTAALAYGAQTDAAVPHFRGPYPAPGPPIGVAYPPAGPPTGVAGPHAMSENGATAQPPQSPAAGAATEAPASSPSRWNQYSP